MFLVIYTHLLLNVMPRRRIRRVVRRRGAGPIGSTLGGLAGSALGNLIGFARRKRRVGRRVRRVRRRGGNFVTTAVEKAVRGLATRIKENAAERLGQFIGNHKYGNPLLGRMAQRGIYKLGEMVGVGRRRRRVRRGGSLITSALGLLGMGRRRRVRRGGSLFSEGRIGGNPQAWGPFVPSGYLTSAPQMLYGARRRRGGRSYRQLIF